jgi:predicted DNA-binding transcriptional regulator AlpA
VSGHDLGRPVQALKNEIPCAAGPRAAAPSKPGPQHARFSRVGWKPGFGLLGEMQRSAHFKKLTTRFTFFVSLQWATNLLDIFTTIWKIRSVMNLYSTTEAAKKLGIGLATLSRYIEEKKVPAPSFLKAGKRTNHAWAEEQIEHVRQLLPKIANGRKTRYQKLREKQKAQPVEAVPHKTRKPKKKK